MEGGHEAERTYSAGRHRAMSGTTLFGHTGALRELANAASGQAEKRMEDAQVSGRGFLGLSQNGISAHEIIGAQCRFIREAWRLGGGWRRKLTDDRKTPRRVDGWREEELVAQSGSQVSIGIPSVHCRHGEGWGNQKQPFMSSVLNQSVIPTCLKQIESSFCRGSREGKRQQTFASPRPPPPRCGRAHVQRGHRLCRTIFASQGGEVPEQPRDLVEQDVSQQFQSNDESEVGNRQLRQCSD